MGASHAQSKRGKPEGDAGSDCRGLPVLAGYFAGGYLHGEVLEGCGPYAAVLEEVYQHSMERLVAFFEHGSTRIRVWSEVLDLRAAAPVLPRVLFHYTTREGLWQILDYQRPIGAALQTLREEGAVSALEPEQLNTETRLKYCLPLLVPETCCRGVDGSALKNVLLSFKDEELQRINAHGWILRPKLLDRHGRQPPGTPVTTTQDFWRCLGDYGIGLLMAGHPQLALQTCRQASDGCRSQYGELHPDALRLQHNVGTALHHSGMKADAENTFHSVWRSRTQTLGQHHPATLRSLSELAVVVAHRSPVEAKELQRQALKGKQAYYGVSHPESLSAMVSLAYSLWKEDRQSEAEDLYRRALLIAESTLGPNHPTTLHCLNNLAVIAKDSGRTGELGRLLGRRPGGANAAAVRI